MGLRGSSKPLTAQAVVADELGGGDPVYFNRLGGALVTWNRDLKAVCVESHGWANTAEPRAVLEAGIRAMRAHRGSRWLVDGRRMKVVRQEDQDWINENWLPRALGAGLRLTAVVVPTGGRR